jgi:hypothetical protein
MTQTVDEKTRTKWRQLVDRLIFATDSGVIAWQAAVGEDQFLTNLKDKIVTLGLSADSSRNVYFFRIDDDFNGNKIDYFDDEDLDQNGYYNNEDRYFERLKDFHNSLSRKVSGADAVLDELLGELPVIPEPDVKKRDLDEEIPF